MTYKPWGYHLILDCADVDNHDRPEVMETFVFELLKDIGMVAWGKCQINHFAEREELAGWTVIQPLTTSTLVLHFLDNTRDMYFDLFSCSEFDTKHVRRLITKYFNPSEMKETFLERQA